MKAIYFFPKKSCENAKSYKANNLSMGGKEIWFVGLGNSSTLVQV